MRFGRGERISGIGEFSHEVTRFEEGRLGRINALFPATGRVVNHVQKLAMFGQGGVEVFPQPCGCHVNEVYTLALTSCMEA